MTIFMHLYLSIYRRKCGRRAYLVFLQTINLRLCFTSSQTLTYLSCLYYYFFASLVAQLVKNSSAMRETWVQSLGWENPLEKGKATHSSILACRIPWTVWGHNESDTTE